MIIPDPDCNRQCRYTRGITSTTMVCDPPLYDREGNKINSDRNVTSYEMHCIACDRRWRLTSRNNAVESCIQL